MHYATNRFALCILSELYLCKYVKSVHIISIECTHTYVQLVRANKCVCLREYLHLHKYCIDLIWRKMEAKICYTIHSSYIWDFTHFFYFSFYLFFCIRNFTILHSESQISSFVSCILHFSGTHMVDGKYFGILIQVCDSNIRSGSKCFFLCAYIYV